jgi:aspartate/methionine/tyrosine aminotransferase
MIKHDFAFGDTRGIRKKMLRQAKKILSLPLPWEDMGYPPHTGDLALIENTKKLIKDLTGKTYEYVIITNGATHAINAGIHALKTVDTGRLLTHHLYFGFYPQIASINNLEHKRFALGHEPISTRTDIVLVDSPNNPSGFITPQTFEASRTIWDAAYWSPTYTKDWKKLYVPPAHVAMVGSYNKLTGINGLRVGWLATNDLQAYFKAHDYVTNTLCGVTSSGQWAVNKILENVNLEVFYKESANLIDANKEELGRLNRLFGNQEIPEVGMFALWASDRKINEILAKAGVKFMYGKEVGSDPMSWRINLGNTFDQTRAMVEDVLRADKI